ncbi:MAG: tRNA threonylcarbamoyladenosine dehydratase [Myxococcota bacterium]|nr:tRNA threonylcarbamoyladenosine dehydratase [Myxococcota bacterium]
MQTTTKPLEVEDWQERTHRLIGDEGLLALAAARVAVFGIGGVGSYAVEALARAGIGHLTLIDHDKICASNINRQLHATRATIGGSKVAVMGERLRQINPAIGLDLRSQFYEVGSASAFLDTEPPLSFVVDAIDSVPSKLDLIIEAQQRGIPIVSAMGAGNKLDPSRFCITDISQSHSCPLARVIRRELRKRGVQQLQVVFSSEAPVQPKLGSDSTERGPGSISFVPAVAGMLLASAVVRSLLAAT